MFQENAGHRQEWTHTQAVMNLLVNVVLLDYTSIRTQVSVWLSVRSLVFRGLCLKVNVKVWLFAR